MLLLLVFLTSTCVLITEGYECSFSENENEGILDRSGSFSSDLWYWPHHRVYFRFAESVIKEDREVIREVMSEIEDNTCVTFVETSRRRYKYLTITTEKSYNCMMCYYLGFVCPLKNGGSVRSSPFCTKAFDCPYYYGSVGMRLQFTLPFCGRLTQRWKALITHELLHVLGLIHTQNRADRDKYITIHEDAIDKKSISQYMPKCYNCQTYDLPYECDSVMHYGWMDFAASGRLLAFFRPTMSPRDSSCQLTSDGGVKPTKADWEMARRTQRCGQTSFRP